MPPSDSFLGAQPEITFGGPEGRVPCGSRIFYDQTQFIPQSYFLKQDYYFTLVVATTALNNYSLPILLRSVAAKHSIAVDSYIKP